MKDKDYKIKREILEKYLKKHNLSPDILGKIDIHSFHTDNFVYKAIRIGNNIGDIYEIAMDITFLEVIAQKFNLKLDMVDYPELHTKDISESELDILVGAAKLFESRNDRNKNDYEKIIKVFKNNLKEEFKKIF